jgi:ABC-type phosphate/phosphonate transport system substrate-binding protein
MPESVFKITRSDRLDDQLRAKLFKDMEDADHDYEKICSLISAYVGKRYGYREFSEENYQRAMDLYQEMKEAAFDLGYLTENDRK